jgi:iron-sulfur cluster repair protein YtfE (RIC family)
MHIAMRRDARRLMLAAPSVHESELAAVNVWWRQLHEVIDWHHRAEDDVLWPKLRATVPGFAANEHALNVDHSALEQAMNAVSAAVHPGAGRAFLRQSAIQFASLLTEHLRQEEAVVFPIFVNVLPLNDYLSIERRIIESAPMKVMTYLQPWMFDGLDRKSAAAVAATIPPPVRVLGNTILRWRYERTLSTVLAAADRPGPG